MVEVDFISRFLRTKTFIKSADKEKFYAVIEKVERKIKEQGIDINTLITNQYSSKSTRYIIMQMNRYLLILQRMLLMTNGAILFKMALSLEISFINMT